MSWNSVHAERQQLDKFEWILEYVLDSAADTMWDAITVQKMFELMFRIRKLHIESLQIIERTYMVNMIAQFPDRLIMSVRDLHNMSRTSSQQYMIAHRRVIPEVFGHDGWVFKLMREYSQVLVYKTQVEVVQEIVSTSVKYMTKYGLNDTVSEYLQSIQKDLLSSFRFPSLDCGDGDSRSRRSQGSGSDEDEYEESEEG